MPPLYWPDHQAQLHWLRKIKLLCCLDIIVLNNTQQAHICDAYDLLAAAFTGISGISVSATCSTNSLSAHWLCMPREHQTPCGSDSSPVIPRHVCNRDAERGSSGAISSAGSRGLNSQCHTQDGVISSAPHSAFTSSWISWGVISVSTSRVIECPCPKVKPHYYL